jgi:hypothetical protein
METAAENQTPNPILLRVRLVSSMQEPYAPTENING